MVGFLPHQISNRLNSANSLLQRDYLVNLATVINMESGESLDIKWHPLDLPEDFNTPEDEEKREKNSGVGVLNEARLEIEKIVQNEPGIDPEDIEFSIDALHLDLESRHFQWGRFSFWGGLVSTWAFPELWSKKDKLPVIKNIRLPESMRGKGVGSRIVQNWEQVFKNNNFDYSVVTNVNTPDSVKFWEKQGYKLRPGDTRDNAYYMFKKLEG